MPKKPVRSNDTTFYSDGSRTETSTDYYKNGKPRRVEVIEYDATGKPTKETTTWLTSTGKATDLSVTVSEYHSNGKLSRKVTKESPGPDEPVDRVTEYNYDNKGKIKNITSEVHYRDRQGRKTKTRTSKNDNNGGETHDQMYDPETGRKVGFPEEVILKKHSWLHQLWQ